MKLIEMDLWNLYDDPRQVDGYEDALKSDPKVAYQALLDGNLAQHEINIAEKTISTSSKYAFHYAYTYFIRKRFPAGETAIAKLPYYSYLYALHVLKGRFPQGETVLATNPENAYKYAKRVMKGEFKEGTNAIMNSPFRNQYKMLLKNTNIKV